MYVCMENNLCKSPINIIKILNEALKIKNL